MSLPDSMTAVEISEPGGPEVLRPVTRPVPVPGYGQVLIRVAYAGVNRPDALQRAGTYAPPPGASDLPGLEASGDGCGCGPGRVGVGGGRRGLRAAAGRRIRGIRGDAGGALPGRTQRAWT